MSGGTPNYVRFALNGTNQGLQKSVSFSFRSQNILKMTLKNHILKFILLFGVNITYFRSQPDIRAVSISVWLSRWVRGGLGAVSTPCLHHDTAVEGVKQQGVHRSPSLHCSVRAPVPLVADVASRCNPCNHWGPTQIADSGPHLCQIGKKIRQFKS